MKRRMNIFISILCICALLLSCGTPKPSDDSGKKEEIKKTPTQYKLEEIKPKAYRNVKGLSLEPGSFISIIGRYSDDSYWKEVENGAKQAVADLNKELGYKGSDKIRLSYCAPSSRDDVNQQVNLLDQELDRTPLAIGIATIDATACAIQFDLASENGIPVVTLDSGNNYQYVASHISTDNLLATQKAAEEMAKSIEQKGEIIVFSQDSISTTATTRLNGFVDAIKKSYPEITIAETYCFDQLESMAETIIAEREDEELETKDISQEDVIEYILKKHPNAKGIYATNLDTTQAVAKVLEKTEIKNLKFIGFDGGKEQAKLLEKGILDGIVIQNPFGMGYATVVAMARVSLGIANSSFVNTGFQWVTPKNMNSEKIKSLLY